MAGKSPHQAVRNFVEPINRALSCITKSVAVASGHDPVQERHALALNQGEPVRLRGNPPFLFTAIVHYQIFEAKGDLGPWKVSTMAYYYGVQDRKGQELLAYHWHPRSTPQHSDPHLHVYEGAGAGIITKLHLPTRGVSLEELLRFLITELKVIPIKRDWEEILRATRAVHEQFRSWS